MQPDPALVQAQAQTQALHFQTALPEHPKAVHVLVFGLLGLILCPVFALIAWFMGHKARLDIRAQRYQPSSMVTMGWVLGWVGTLLAALATVGGVVVVAAFGNQFSKAFDRRWNPEGPVVVVEFQSASVAELFDAAAAYEDALADVGIYADTKIFGQRVHVALPPGQNVDIARAIIENPPEMRIVAEADRVLRGAPEAAYPAVPDADRYEWVVIADALPDDVWHTDESGRAWLMIEVAPPDVPALSITDVAYVSRSSSSYDPNETEIRFTAASATRRTKLSELSATEGRLVCIMLNDVVVWCAPLDTAMPNPASFAGLDYREYGAAFRLAMLPSKPKVIEVIPQPVD